MLAVLNAGCAVVFDLLHPILKETLVVCALWVVGFGALYNKRADLAAVCVVLMLIWWVACWLGYGP